jgi:hypothetical protein
LPRRLPRSAGTNRCAGQADGEVRPH